MGYTLKRLNVVKSVESEAERDRLVEMGFALTGEDADDKPLSELDYAVLKERAKEAGIKGYSKMKKDELVAELEKLTGADGDGGSDDGGGGVGNEEE